MFLYKNQFLLIFSFLSIPIELWESTAAICGNLPGMFLFVVVLFVVLSFSLKNNGFHQRSTATNLIHSISLIEFDNFHQTVCFRTVAVFYENHLLVILIVNLFLGVIYKKMYVLFDVKSNNVLKISSYIMMILTLKMEKLSF